MNQTINKVTLIGNLVKKPDLRETTSGVPVCTFHLITDREWETADKEIKKESTKHICVAWEKLAEICHKILDRGDLVFIRGRLQNNRFIDPQGIERDQMEVIVQEMFKL